VICESVGERAVFSFVVTRKNCGFSLVYYLAFNQGAWNLNCHRSNFCLLVWDCLYAKLKSLVVTTTIREVSVNLHPPIANLTKFQKGVYYSWIKIFNNLPHDIKDLGNEITLFRNALIRFLLINSFYNSEEYFNYQR
jgi:hypothetical protein